MCGSRLGAGSCPSTRREHHVSSHQGDWRCCAARSRSVSFIVTRASGSAPPPYLSYAAKFACGEYGKLIPGERGRQPRRPGQAGRLPNGNQRAQPASRCGDQLREKGGARLLGHATREPDRIRASQAAGTPAHGEPAPGRRVLIDCQDIRKFLLTGSPVPAPAAPTFIEGWVKLSKHPISRRLRTIPWMSRRCTRRMGTTARCPQAPPPARRLL